MKKKNAVSEVCKLWGEMGAICKSGDDPAEYLIGYFEESGESLLFHIMGSGRTLEKAFEQLNLQELKESSQAAN
jgi:hypothetical protein